PAQPRTTPALHHRGLHWRPPAPIHPIPRLHTVHAPFIPTPRIITVARRTHELSMTDPQQQPPGSADGVPAAGLLDHDSLTRFLLQDAGVRGVRVHLDATWQQIGSRSESPAAVRELL